MSQFPINTSQRPTPAANLASKAIGQDLKAAGGRSADDDFCGTPVPGHHGPIPHLQDQVTLSPSAQSGLAGGTFDDDNWCGTKVPGGFPRPHGGGPTVGDPHVQGQFFG